MTEVEFSRKVRSALKMEGYLCRPVETAMTGAGFPDLFVLGKGVACFIELKSRPKKLAAKVIDDLDLEGQGQKAFLKAFASGTSIKTGKTISSRQSFLLCSCRDGSVLFSYSPSFRDVAAMWEGGEGFFDRRELSDAIRAFHFSCMPSREALGMDILETALLAAEGYAAQAGACAEDISDWVSCMLAGREKVLASKSEARLVAASVQEAARDALRRQANG